MVTWTWDAGVDRETADTRVIMNDGREDSDDDSGCRKVTHHTGVVVLDLGPLRHIIRLHLHHQHTRKSYTPDSARRSRRRSPR